jgi:stage III sporulation protein AH
MLRKQTIWLLTMLSLVIVLSVYYVTQERSQTAAKIEEGEKGGTAETNEGAKEVAEESNEGFDQLRIMFEEQRGKKESELQALVTNSKATAEEKSKAQDKINELGALGQKEENLEVTIKKEGYKDVLVSTDGAKAKITVQADKLTKEQANKIMQIARKELGISPVTVSNVSK